MHLVLRQTVVLLSIFLKLSLVYVIVSEFQGNNLHLFSFVLEKPQGFKLF